MVYKKFNVTDISKLDGKSFVIANFNPSPYADIGALTNQPKKENFQGLIGNKNITCQNNDKNPPITSADTLTQWTFEKVDKENQSDNKFYIYSNVNGLKQYMSISGGEGSENVGGDVFLSDTPVELYISQHQDYAKKIKITNKHGMALNWYGQNGVSEIFSGWKAYIGNNDVNDFHTLLEAKNTDNNYDYTWFAKNSNDNIEVCFQKNMNLADDEALYIVVRTALIKPHGEFNNNTRFINGVETKQNSSSSSNWVHANNAEYILKTATPVFKEGKEAYRFDGTNWTAPAKNRLQYWQKNLITEPGTYAEWLINVNWDGSMQGKAEFSDKLPDYLTPVYLCPYWLCVANTNFPTIPTLEADDNWIKKENNSTEYPNYDTLTYYYNPSTNELRCAIDGLEKETDPVKINSKTVNLQLICKVNDPDILLSGVTKIIDNTVTVKNKRLVHRNTGTVNISPECSLSKRFAGNHYNNDNNKTTNRRLKFEITVNPYKETLGSNNVLPPLIDEIDSNLIIIESSLVVKTENGEIISGYTYDIEDNKLTINKLPDKQKLIITYSARLKTAPTADKEIIVSNKAYWEGHEQPMNPQVNELQVVYDVNGNVNLTSKPTVSILKVDSEDRMVGLNGATFELYKYKGNTDNTDMFIGSGTTGDDGKLVFKNNNNEIRVDYDTVYYIKETAAPNGYKLDPNNKHYFVVLDDNTSNYPDFQGIPDLDKFDSHSFEKDSNGNYICIYECIIENSKEKIRVEKTFKDENNQNFFPDSGKFRFGIFDKDPETHSDAKPLQILEIEYVNGEPQYKLDNESKTDPEFTIAKPNETYFVFELDESQKPIFNDDYLNTNDNTFKVKYTSQLSNCNEVTIAKNTISIENQIVYFTMPEAGGMGLKKYYLIAGSLSVIAILIALKIKGVSKKLFGQKR